MSRIRKDPKLCFDVLGVIFQFVEFPKDVFKLINLSRWTRNCFLHSRILSEITFVFSSFPRNIQKYVKKIRIKGNYMSENFGRIDESSRWDFEDCENLMKYFPNLDEVECGRLSTPFTEKHVSTFQNVRRLNFVHVQTHEEREEDFVEPDDYLDGLGGFIRSTLKKNSFETDYIFINCGYSSRLVDGNSPNFSTKSIKLIKPNNEEEEEYKKHEKTEEVLKGVKICFKDGNIGPLLSIYQGIAVKFGAEVLPSFTPDVTHLIYPRHATVTTNLVQKALSNENNQTLVLSADWIFECFKERRKCDESRFLMFMDELYSDTSRFETKEYKVVFVTWSNEEKCHEFDSEGGGQEILQKIKELLNVRPDPYFDGVLFTGKGTGEKLRVDEIERIIGMMTTPDRSPHCGCFKMNNMYEASVMKIDGKLFYIAFFDTESG